MSNGSGDEEGCHLDCEMGEEQRMRFDVVAVVRTIMACLSIVGALSIVASAVYRRTTCNPKVHPIFVLSIVDTLLSVLWISGGLVWLKGDGFRHHQDLRVGCFAINCLTVILQCVAMNLTLIYSLLAYTSIKQRDFSGVYMVQRTPVSVNVWPPHCSFAAYFIAWTLPIVFIVVPFVAIAEEFDLVRDANNCSCWCLPFLGNVLPRPQFGLNYHNGLEGDQYLIHLHYFIGAYSMVLVTNFTLVLCCMAVVYCKVFRRIKRMILMQENNENTPLYGATRAMILEGHKNAKKRVFLFLSVYIISGSMILLMGVLEIADTFHQDHASSHSLMTDAFVTLFLEALLVPSQGFLNALVYGWTRGDFLSVMSASRQQHNNRHQPESLTTSYDRVEEEEEEEETTEVEDERKDWFQSRNSLLFSSSHHSTAGRQTEGTVLTPVSPGGLLGDNICKTVHS